MSDPRPARRAVVSIPHLSTETPDFGGQWFAFPDEGDTFKYDAVAKRFKLPHGTVKGMFEDGTLGLLSPAGAADMFGPDHRYWHVYWRGAPSPPA